MELKADVEFLAANELAGRRTLYAGSQIAARYVAAEFAKAGLHPIGASFLQEFSIPEDVVEQIRRVAGPEGVFPAAPYKSVNVVGVLAGADRNLSSETVIVGAHYDHLGVIKGQVYPGADDNASGVAALLGVARAIRRSNTPHKRTLVFIAFGAEEVFFLGSRYYVEHPLRPLQTTRAVINFDIVGRTRKPMGSGEYQKVPEDTANELLLVGTNYSPTYRRVVEHANRSVGLNLHYDLDSTSIFRRSDHYSFARQGIPAIRWTTGYHPDYHTSRDTIDKIDFEKLRSITILAGLAIRDFANIRKPPEWTMKSTE